VRVRLIGSPEQPNRNDFQDDLFLGVPKLRLAPQLHDELPEAAGYGASVRNRSQSLLVNHRSGILRPITRSVVSGLADFGLTCDRKKG
jgi:hypothetical protein